MSSTRSSGILRVAEIIGRSFASRFLLASIIITFSSTGSAFLADFASVENFGYRDLTVFEGQF
jgi:hypothetical protein